MYKLISYLRCLSAFIVGVAVLDAQSPAVQSAPVISAQQRIAAIQTAKGYFKVGDITNGESTLFAVNRDAVGTPEWYKESGQALIGEACMFKQDRDGKTAQSLGKEALSQLNLALAGAGTNKKLIGNIYMLIGFAQERLYGTRAQAEASYSLAVQNLPAGGHVAKVLRRMQEEDAILATRGKPSVASK